MWFYGLFRKQLHQSLQYFMRTRDSVHHIVNTGSKIDMGTFFLPGTNTLLTEFCPYLPTVCGKFNNFSPPNLTETQWPWHVAVYIRSPPDPSSTVGPPGAAMFVQQGDSEESTFWVLACSGALLSQRSILVAAQCVVDKHQTLQPAHMRVVMGVHHQRKSLRWLMVPDDLHVRLFALSTQSLWRNHVVYIIFTKRSHYVCYWRSFKEHFSTLKGGLCKKPGKSSSYMCICKWSKKLSLELLCDLKSSQSPNWINNCRFIYPVSTNKPNITKLSRLAFLISFSSSSPTGFRHFSASRCWFGCSLWCSCAKAERQGQDKPECVASVSAQRVSRRGRGAGGVQREVDSTAPSRQPEPQHPYQPHRKGWNRHDFTMQRAKCSRGRTKHSD